MITESRLERRGNGGPTGRKATGIRRREDDPNGPFKAPLDPADDRGSLPRGWHEHAPDDGPQGDPELEPQPSHLHGGMSRKDLKEVGEMLDESDAALIVVGEATVERAIEEQTKRAKKEIKKEVRAEAKDIEKAIDAA